MLNLEINLFPNISKILKLKNEILIIAKDLLKEKIIKKDIEGNKVIFVLNKLKSDLSNSETFNIEYKKMIIKYFIEKCKDNDYETLKNYKYNKIYELFMNSSKEHNLLFNVIEDEEFDINQNFIRILPDELNEKELDIIAELINKIIEKTNPIEIEQNVAKDYSLFNFIYKNKDFFLIFLGKIKFYQENQLKILSLIIGVINNNEKKEGKLYEKIFEYLDNNFFNNNIFIVEVN